MSILDNKSDFFKFEKPAKRAKDDLANAVNDYDKMADIESDDQKSCYIKYFTIFLITFSETSYDIFKKFM